MLARWPIRKKLLLCISLLLVVVATLSASGSYGLYSYRSLVKSLSGRSTELPLAAELSHQIGDLQIALSEVRSRHDVSDRLDLDDALDNQLLRERFRMNLDSIRDTLIRYHQQLDQNVFRSDARISDDRSERQSLARIEIVLTRIDQDNSDQAWIFDQVKIGRLHSEIEQLQALAMELPNHLRRRLAALATDVRVQYRTAIALTWMSTIAAAFLFLLFVRLFYRWVLWPLRVLIEGSRQVAAGRFGYRIHLNTDDEMSELAEAMNDMTERFQAVRDDLDRQVRERTKQVVRSEQLASVGFLAAGVAHEINNPLASIAFCAESLESRVAESFSGDDDAHAVIRNYLRMIQDEAFRCKGITEKLLDYSRMGDVQRQRTELRELVQGVIEMVGHVGRYQNKRVEFLAGDPVVAEVSAPEIKQAVLNLIANGLDSLDEGGSVTVELASRGETAELVFSDNGCGMSDEVMEHLFEPFFTRRRGGQGTGLGLSITYRIIADHHGHIEVASAGQGKGSRFVVTLPLAGAGSKLHHKENDHRYQAA